MLQAEFQEDATQFAGHGLHPNTTISSPSKTAEMAAAIRELYRRRAKQSLFDRSLYLGPMRIFLASRGLQRRTLSNLVVDTLLATSPGTMPLVYRRARFGEDLLEASIKGELDQYVIAG